MNGDRHMYFVDKELLIERLDYIEKLSHEVESQDGFALERVCHMLIEVTVDVGNMIIDGFILRDPGSYSDVMDIMALEGVMSEENKNKIVETFEWRQKLQREYTNIDHQSLKEDFTKAKDLYAQFKQEVYRFFENENQSITAFKADKN